MGIDTPTNVLQRPNFLQVGSFRRIRHSICSKSTHYYLIRRDHESDFGRALSSDGSTFSRLSFRDLGVRLLAPQDERQNGHGCNLEGCSWCSRPPRTATAACGTAPMFYIGTRKQCCTCAQRPQCTSAAFRSLAIPMDGPARQRARELAKTAEFARAQRQRGRWKRCSRKLKNQIGLRRLGRQKLVRKQFFLQNIKRLVRFLSKPTTPVLSATT